MAELSIIVPLHGFDPQREEAVKLMLKTIDAQDLRKYDSNSQPLPDKNFEVLFIEQATGGKSHIFERKPHFKHYVIADQPGRGFNKSWCMNVGAKLAKTNHLVFLDADMVFSKEFFDKIHYFKLSSNAKYFTCWSYIVSMPGKDVPIPRIITKDTMTSGGAFYIEKHFYWDLGGMHENYFGYGGEDNDLWIRVNNKLGEKGQVNIVAMPYALGHWYHDWAAPSPVRFHVLNRTIQHPDEIIRRLRAVGLGNSQHPTLIEIDDLKLADAGIENKESKGML